MQNARWLQVALLTATLASSQTMIDLRTQSKSVDFSGANATKPFQTGNSLPSTCTVGQMFYLSSAAPGANVYGCTATNAWTLQGGTNLPGTSGNSGKFLSTDGLFYVWSAIGGDLSGSLTNATVTQLQGRPVSNATPGSGQVLGWNGSAWTPQNASGGSSTTGGDLSGAITAATVIQIQGRPVSGSTPSSGQFLGWNGTAWAPANPPSGGGSGSGGATIASQLGDFAVTRSSGTALTVGASCSTTTPCNYRFGGQTIQITNPATLTLNSGSGMVYVYLRTSGLFVAPSNTANVSCTGGCILDNSVTNNQYPFETLPIFRWNATNGSFDPTGFDDRAFLSTKTFFAGTGIQITESPNSSTVAVDPSVVPLFASVPTSSTTACSPGAWSADTTYFYICVAQNKWYRAAFSTSAW